MGVCPVNVPTKQHKAGVVERPGFFDAGECPEKHFAITQIEAMSHGLPVITTPNCGEVVSDRIDGNIVPIRDAKALAAAIEAYASDRSKLIEASEKNGIWTLQASIFPQNEASIALHKSCGFREVGVRERIARLHGVWRNTVLLERRSKAVGNSED